METAADTGLGWVDRFREQIEEGPGGRHVYASLLGLRTYEAIGLHERLEEGLSYHAMERLRSALDVPVTRMGDLLRISPRTLARRRDSGRLEPQESDRLRRLARLVGLVLELFEGDLDHTRAWLSAPHHALGGEAPLGLASTEVGAREVERLIGRLEHGVAT